MPPVSRIIRMAGRVLAVVLLVLLLAGGGTYCYLKANVDTIARELLAEIAKNTGLVISVDGVGVELLPMPALTLTHGSVKGVGLTFTVAYVTVTPDITALIRGVFHGGNVHMVRPRLHYTAAGGSPAKAHAASNTADGSASAPTHKPASSPTAAPVLDEGLMRNFWPEGSRFRSEDGQADVTLADGTHISLAGLNCNLKSGEDVAVRGHLSLNRLLLERPSFPATLFTNVSMEGASSIFSLTPGKPHIWLAFDVQSGSWLDTSHVVLDFTGGSQSWKLAAKLDGHFLKDGTQLPYALKGQFARDMANKPQLVSIDDTHFSLGRDSAVLDGSLRLPATADRWLDEASLEGTLRVARVSLTEWLGFGRLLPAGLQISLDEVTDGTLEFNMDGKGLRVPHIVASCQGSTFKGQGGVEDWRKPVVFLDLLAPQVNLGRAIPEAVAILPSEPDYGHGPLTPEGTTPTAEELAARAKAAPEEEILVGYDIRLGADTVNYGPLVINDARVRIHPGPYDKDGNSDSILDATARLYKGDFQGTLVLGWQEWLPYTITVKATGVDGKGIAGDLPVLPFIGGTWQGEGRVTSKGKELDIFLANLRGTVKVDGKQGGLPIALPRHESTSLSLALGGGKWKDNHLGLTGQWQGSLTGHDMHLQGETSGYVWFGERANGRDVVDFEKLRGWLRMQAQAGTLGLERGIDARLDALFSLRPRQLDLGDARLHALGATASGQWRVLEEKGGYVFVGPVSLEVPHLATTLGALGQSPSLPHFLKSLQVKADVRATPRDYTLSKIQAKVGHTTATGNLSGPWGRKQLAVDMTLDSVDLDRYFPVAAKAQGDKGKDEETERPQTLTAGSDTVTPPRKKSSSGGNKGPSASRSAATSLDYSFMKAWTAQGTLKVRSLTCRKVKIDNLVAPFTLQNGKLDVAKLEGQSYGGAVRGSGHVLFDRSLGLKGKAQATNVGLAAAMRGRGLLMQGSAELYADLAATLATTADWPRALGGTWRFAMHNGQFQNADKDGTPRGKPTAFTLGQATGNIVAGVVRSKDILLRGPGMEIRGEGKLDLPKEDIDCELDVNMKGLPDFPLRLYGSLDKPRTSIGAGTLLLNALGGIGSGFIDTVGGLFTGIGKIFTPSAK